MSNTITCILCGQRKPGSMEDVIPRWVRKHLGITGDVTTRVGDNGQQRVDPLLSVLLRRVVCEDCNNGWMSQLEEKVKPFLGPMLLNEWVPDGVASLLLLARDLLVDSYFNYPYSFTAAEKALQALEACLRGCLLAPGGTGGQARTRSAHR